MSRIRGLGRDRAGSVAIEAALVMCFVMAPLLALAADAGRALMLQYQVNRALHAALIHGWGVSGAPAADVVAAAQDGYGGTAPALTATASYSSLCIPILGTRLLGVAVPGTGTCLAGQVLGTWMTATTSVGFAPIFPAAWSQAPWTISASATVRVK